MDTRSWWRPKEPCIGSWDVPNHVPVNSLLEHSNSRFDSIRFYSFCKKSAFRFTSCHAVFLAYLLYSLSQKISWRYWLRRLILQNVDKNSYAMHTLKITPNLLFDYRCTSGKLIRLPNRIESNLFCPNWNALLCITLIYYTAIVIFVNIVSFNYDLTPRRLYRPTNVLPIVL